MALPGHLALSRDLRDAAHVRFSDNVLVSFPKSGRTFVRVMLARLYQRAYGHDETNVLQFGPLRWSAARLPLIAFTHDGDAMRTPDQVDTAKTLYQGCNVALLARHPADTAVSRYHHLKGRSSDPARRALAEQPLEDFIWTDQGGIPSIVAFLNSWARQRHTPHAFHLFSYEKLRNETNAELAALARFLKLPSGEHDIADAVEFASFENLKKKEASGYFSSSRFGERVPGEGSSAKVRSGKVGGYRGLFGAEQIDRIDAYVSERLDPLFGYGRGDVPDLAASLPGHLRA